MRRIRVGGTCEAPTELYARDTAGRSAGSHSPSLFYLSHTRPLRRGGPGKTSEVKSHSGIVASPREREREKTAEKAINICMWRCKYSGSPQADRGRDSRPVCSEALKALAWPLSLRI